MARNTNNKTNIFRTSYLGMLRPWQVKFNHALSLVLQNIQQPRQPQSWLLSPAVSKTCGVSVLSKTVLWSEMFRAWLNFARRVTLDDSELNLLHLSLLISWCTSGAKLDLPSWCCIFSMRTYLDMSSPFRPFEFMSAGFSVPFTLFSFSLRLILSCCSHRYDVSMWRSFPSPVRPMIPSAADASAMISAL